VFQVLRNQTQVLGGVGTVYQWKPDGPPYLDFRGKAEKKRFRQSLETTDKDLAVVPHHVNQRSSSWSRC
jgi:hypothetical protein